MAETKPGRGLRIIGALVLVFGLVFVAVGARFLQDSYNFNTMAHVTTGRVVSVEANTDSQGGVSYRPTIRYFDIHGNKQLGKTLISSTSYNYDVGTQVRIRFKQSSPSEIRMDNWFALWGFGVVFTVAGLVPVAIGLLLLRLGRRKARMAVKGDMNRLPRRAEPARKAAARPDIAHVMDHAATPARTEKRQPTVRRRR